MLRIKNFTEGAPELAAWCVGQREGAVEVLRAEWSEGIDHLDHWAVFLDITLSKPPEGARTWPVDDRWALRRRIRDKANELLTAEYCWLRFHSAGAAARHDDDPGDEEEP
jgi:hypothetical protein